MSNPLLGLTGGSTNTVVTIPTLPYPNGQSQGYQTKSSAPTNLKSVLEDVVRTLQATAERSARELSDAQSRLNKLGTYDPKVVELYDHLMTSGYLTCGTSPFTVLNVLQAHTDAIEYKTTLSNL